MRFALELSYNGAAYHGWQVQNNAHTVQAEINTALATLLGHEVETLGCGRTDTGVHALQYFAQFDTDKLPVNPVFRLNRMIPEDIAIKAIYQVPENFNARFDAAYRLYEYHLHRKADPFLTGRSYYRFGGINFAAMNAAAKKLFEYEDFECFSKSRTQVKTFRCHIMQAEWKQLDEFRWVFIIKADRFLRNMVRAIVGTLMEAGNGKLDTAGFEDIIKSKKRTEAGQSVPAHALYLAQVGYDFKNWIKIDEQ